MKNIHKNKIKIHLIRLFNTDIFTVLNSFSRSPHPEFTCVHFLFFLLKHFFFTKHKLSLARVSYYKINNLFSFLFSLHLIYETSLRLHIFQNSLLFFSRLGSSRPHVSVASFPWRRQQWRRDAQSFHTDGRADRRVEPRASQPRR